MPSMNKVFLAGNLTRNPELRYTPGGTAVAQFGMAVNRRFRNREGQMQEEATFVDIEVWGRQAETSSEFLSKGSPVLIEGRLKLDTWESKQTGERRSKLRVVGERVQFLGSRPRGEGREGGRGGGRDSGREGGRGGGRGGRSQYRDRGRGDRRPDSQAGGPGTGQGGGPGTDQGGGPGAQQGGGPGTGQGGGSGTDQGGGDRGESPKADGDKGEPPKAAGGLPPDDDIPF